MVVRLLPQPWSQKTRRSLIKDIRNCHLEIDQTPPLCLGHSLWLRRLHHKDSMTHLSQGRLPLQKTQFQPKKRYRKPRPTPPRCRHPIPGLNQKQGSPKRSLTLHLNRYPPRTNLLLVGLLRVRQRQIVTPLVQVSQPTVKNCPRCNLPRGDLLLESLGP